MKRSNLAGVVACMGIGLVSVLGVAAALAQPSTKDIKKELPKLPAPPATAPGKDAKPAASQPDPAAMQEAWMKLMEKNEHHERFKAFEGTWDCVVKHWEDPSKDPSENKGTMVNTLIHEGRYVHHDFKGEMMGMPFTGSGTFGYDNATKQYQGTWMDNMGTGTMFMTGSYDEKARAYTMTGDMNMGGAVGSFKQREVVTMVDNDHHSMVMYSMMPGQPEMKVMEIQYTRAGAKKAATDPASTIEAAKAEAQKKAKEAAEKLKKDIGK